MDTGWCQDDAEEKKRAVGRLITADEVGSVDQRSKGVDVVKVRLNESISVVSNCE
jgi:hypothetical protein